MTTKPIAIVVPGIMGSVLKLGSDVIWPGPVSSLVFRYKLMNELLRDDLIAVDCIRSYSITDQYSRLIADLEACDFHEADGTLVVAAYDWRKDNAKSAETLAEHVDRAVTRHGPSAVISLVAHSMGGLVSRYYLESGQFQQRPGFARVRDLITLGTPHQGAALALPLVLGYEKRLFLNKEQVHQLCRDPRYPAAYQLLPRRGEPFAIDGSANSQLAPSDVYEPGTAKQLGRKTNSCTIEASVRERLPAQPAVRQRTRARSLRVSLQSWRILPSRPGPIASLPWTGTTVARPSACRRK